MSNHRSSSLFESSSRPADHRAVEGEKPSNPHQRPGRSIPARRGFPARQALRLIARGLGLFCLIGFFALTQSGCSAGKSGLIQITPQQYFYSAKEKLEVIDERSYDIRDFDEIIRVLENAEKDAKSSEIIDKSRLYLTLVNTLKARKQYQGNLMKGQYIANRAEPFYRLDSKTVLETLRLAKKWLRACEAQFKTESLKADLAFVKGLYYSQKMLVESGGDKTESLWIAVDSFRKCLGMAPDYKADFRLFGRLQGPREVRLKLIECLAMGGEVAEAWGLLSQYSFTPTSPRLDHSWLHMKGLVLAMMGRLDEAVETLSPFKILSPQDYPQVDEALWVLEGVFNRLREVRKEERYGMEAKIVASMLKTLKGPFSKEQYTTAAHLFPRWMPGDDAFFTGLIAFMEGDFPKARTPFMQVSKHGLLSRTHRLLARILAMENELYAGTAVTDELLEDVLKVSVERGLTPLMKERIGFILARYVMGEDKDFKKGKREGAGQTFVSSIMGKPWALRLTFERGKMTTETQTQIREKRKRDKRNRRSRQEADAPMVPGWTPFKHKPADPMNPVRSTEFVPKPRGTDLGPIPGQEDTFKPEPSGLWVEVYANRPEDWITSADLHLVALPQMSLLGDGRIVGREEEGKGWLFKGEEINELRRKTRYLAIFEYANSDSEKSMQGMLFDL